MTKRARKERARAAGASKSPAKAEAARANGKRGGRPSRARYEEVFAELEPPPLGDPLALATWTMGICALSLYETVKGHGQKEMEQRIRAMAAPIARLMPMERISAAEAKIKASRAPAKPQTRKGPETVGIDAEPPATGSRGPIRR